MDRPAVPGTAQVRRGPRGWLGARGIGRAIGEASPPAAASVVRWKGGVRSAASALTCHYAGRAGKERSAIGQGSGEAWRSEGVRWTVDAAAFIGIRGDAVGPGRGIVTGGRAGEPILTWRRGRDRSLGRARCRRAGGTAARLPRHRRSFAAMCRRAAAVIVERGNVIPAG